MDKNNENYGNKQISINMVANIISYSSNIIISFVLTPFLINALGKDIYSFYPLANTIVSYMSIITNSLNTMASRFITVSLVQNNEEESNKYFSSALASNLIISGILLLPLILIVLFVDKILNVPINAVAAIRMLFSFVFASMLVNIIGSIYGIATFAKNRIDLRSVREIITAIIRLVLFFVFYKFLPVSIVYVGIVTFIVAIINLGFQKYYTKVLLSNIKIKKEYVSKKHTIVLLSSSTWNLIFVFGNTLLAGATLILSNVLFGSDAGGVMSIVQTVPQFINGIISMLVGVFFPVITYMIAQHNNAGAVNQILKAESIISIFSCAIIITFSALSTQFFSLWVPGEDSFYLSQLSFVTILPHIFISCTWILTNLNVAMNRVRKPAIITIIIGALNVILTLVLVPTLKLPLIFLPIISTILQIIWAGIYLPIYASSELNISKFSFYPPLIKAILGSIISFFLIIELKKLFILNTWLTFMIFGVCSGILSIIILAIIELGPNKILEFIKSII